MQSALAIGLAKNGVSVRRAATASQIGGRLSSPSSPVSAEAGALWTAEDTDASVAIKSMPRVASFVDAEKAAAAREAGPEGHLGKRGTTVDKTNPFIGYFQTGTDESEALAAGEEVKATMPPLPPAPVRRVPCRTQSSAALSTMTSFYPSTLFTQQKKVTEWLGVKTSRFPTFFKQRDVKESTKQQKQDDKKQNVILNSLNLEAKALAATDDNQEEQVQQFSQNAAFKRSTSMPVGMAMKARPAVPPIVTSLQTKTATTVTPRSSSVSPSRFEEDFEVVGSLGEGGQGSVFKVRSKVDGCYYAVKKVVLPRATELDAQRAESQALREVRLMASMAPHSNVVRYHTAWTEVDACVAHPSYSTESVRGSDVASLDSVCDQQELCRQQLELLDEEEELRLNSVDKSNQSFSLDFSSDSISFDEYSTPGFTFEDEGDDSVGLNVDDEAAFGQPGKLKLKNEIAATPRDVTSAPVVMKSQVILYIQMELCGAAVDSLPSSTNASATDRSDRHEPIHRILSQLNTSQQGLQQTGEETHSNLGAWLRSSLGERSSWSNTSEKHLEGLKLFLGAVQGVAHMHSYGVIHRDLKPDNIFIHGDVAKIGDFGLSKSVFADSACDGMVSPRERLQELGLSGDEYGDHTTALGTFTYASPEQLGFRFSSNNLRKNAATRLKSAKYSIKSDIFALGVILLELCCPFSTMMERSQVLTGVRHGVVPQKARQQFPMEMDLVLRMTAIDPGERPTSEEVCEQLRKILATSSRTVTPASALDELRELQAKLAAAVRLVRDRSQATLQLEALVSELSDKVQNVGIALA
ncbi:Eukaryotic translation initiation factor 2-alpha kinase [Phytophthora boehmeriae]|uniref:non-specific serine/threonine protein kinase n=1 Tax=Phytophthora boehmeriae TaxID=109152 RepID=A0A8T1WQJ4_9STRA|nr:Eukaryotic translation initiation factor 2-alpha kinase [Phytophthora boehmeriae]